MSQRWPKGRYGVILADPPWRFLTRGKLGPKAAPYAVMSLVDLCRLPVWSLAADDAVCVLWTIQTHMDQALTLMTSWGFRYKTMGAWAKTSSTGLKWSFGTGFIFRCSAEFYIVGTKGKPQQTVKDVRNLIVAPVREHSRKPDQMHKNLERLYPKAAKLELFATARRPGWSSWGNEIGKYQ